MDVELTDLVHGGNAIGRLPDGRAVFVPRCLPGEKVKVEIISEKRGYAHAMPLEILRSHPERINPLCPHFGICGGCHFQHIAYEKQLFYKKSIVCQQLWRIAGISAHDDMVSDVYPSPNPWYYRNTVQYHVHPDGKLGFQAAMDSTIIPIEKCYLIDESLDVFSKQLDIEFITGLERVSLRLGSDEDLLLMLESNDLMPPSFRVDFPLSAVYMCPEGKFLLSGDDYTVIEIMGRPFKVSSGSFFQVNTKMAEALVNRVVSELSLTDKMKVLDLYCGVGLFSAFIAEKVERCVGIEISEYSADDFSSNLDEFDNVELYVGAVEDIVPALDYRPDIVILDPPRAGLHRHVVDWLNQCGSQTILYVSCDTATLARDIRRLTDGNYRLEKVIPFDFFPQTYHVETVVLMSRKEK